MCVGVWVCVRERGGGGRGYNTQVGRSDNPTNIGTTGATTATTPLLVVGFKFWVTRHTPNPEVAQRHQLYHGTKFVMAILVGYAFASLILFSLFFHGKGRCAKKEEEEEKQGHLYGRFCVVSSLLPFFWGGGGGGGWSLAVKWRGTNEEG